jgi:hypothetical protein
MTIRLVLELALAGVWLQALSLRRCTLVSPW